MKSFVIFVFVALLGESVVHGNYNWKEFTDIIPIEDGKIKPGTGDDTSAYTPEQRKQKCAAANEYLVKQIGANPLREDENPSKTLPLSAQIPATVTTPQAWEDVTGFMCFAKRNFVIKEVGQNSTLYVGEPDEDYGIERGVVDNKNTDDTKTA